jgi:hypothetical protein
MSYSYERIGCFFIFLTPSHEKGLENRAYIFYGISFSLCKRAMVTLENSSAKFSISPGLYDWDWADHKSSLEAMSYKLLSRK